MSVPIFRPPALLTLPYLICIDVFEAESLPHTYLWFIIFLENRKVLDCVRKKEREEEVRAHIAHVLTDRSYHQPHRFSAKCRSFSRTQEQHESYMYHSQFWFLDSNAAAF
jgi:hypothetical protein